MGGEKDPLRRLKRASIGALQNVKRFVKDRRPGSRSKDVGALTGRKYSSISEHNSLFLSLDAEHDPEVSQETCLASVKRMLELREDHRGLPHEGFWI
jgi:hypothetical protein